jgi:hypothetical protein
MRKDAQTALKKGKIHSDVEWVVYVVSSICNRIAIQVWQTPEISRTLWKRGDLILVTNAHNPMLSNLGVQIPSML